ncbi:MAG: hypothetical protein MUQ30_03625, partial [Anaerolineae bacterium]|nr:hypothetical protein [Anaerolineae bacterium]
ADLWDVLRRFIFGNGRLARIGGDSRVRYACCQEYLLPSLLYAADVLGDEAVGRRMGESANEREGAGGAGLSCGQDVSAEAA